MRLTYLTDGDGACAWYRCSVPAEALNGRGHDTHVSSRPSVERLRASDLVVLQRPNHAVHLQLAQALKEEGVCVVVELDDDLWNVHPENPAHVGWGRPSTQAVLSACLRLADAVTVTTPELRAKAQRFNAKVHVLPNALPSSHWPPSAKKLPDGEAVVIGWAGSATHMVDLRLLCGVVEHIVASHDQVTFLFAGMPSLPFESHERVRIVPGVRLEDYPALLAEFDIGLAPVVDGPFNSCKSDLKYLEYSMVGIPTIASRTPTYARSIENAKSGLLAGNHKDWLNYTARLIRQPRLRRELAATARSYAESRTIEATVAEWERVYISCMRARGGSDARPELDRPSGRK